MKRTVMAVSFLKNSNGINRGTRWKSDTVYRKILETIKVPANSNSEITSISIFHIDRQQVHPSIVMSHLEMETFIFCAECDQIVNETIDTIRWFELNFCALKCFGKFYRKNAIVCHECESPLTSKKIQVRKLPNYSDTKSNTAAGQQIILSSSSILDSIYFCSPKCLEGFENRVQLCKFCGALSSSNQPFCSEQCRYLTLACNSNATPGMGVCGECNDKKNIVIRMKVDKHKYNMCSSRCFEDFIKKKDLVLETCGNCLQHFKNSNNITYIIQENLCNSTFCSVACLNNYMFTNSKKIECHSCKSYNHYFEMIRGSIRLGTRAWCSLECAANELSTITLATVNRKTASNGEEAQMELLDAVPVANDKGNGTAAEAADQDDIKPIIQSVERESFTHEKIVPLTKVQMDRLIKERLDSFVRKCSSCESVVSNAQPFLRWFAEEFCNQICFDAYLKSNNGCVCWNCDSIIGITKLCVHAEYVENNLRLFCSVGCQSSYLKSHKMCEYCHKIMVTPETVAQQAKRFCSEICEKEHTRIFNIKTDPKTVEAICTDCDKMKEVKAIFVYNEKEYPFCSYSCSFFLKFSCGLFPDKCILCEKFFIRNASNRYTVRYDNIANHLCSDICMTNFMLKHRYMVACQFCLDQNYNFNMLQVIGDKGTKIKYFCSKSCIELVDECAKMAVEHIPNEPTAPTEKNLHILAKSEDEGFQGSPEKVTRDVSVQANMQCTCQKENVRKILNPVRPGKRTSSQFLHPSNVQGFPIQPFKVHRQ